MVNWVAGSDPTMRGYSPSAHKLAGAQYSFPALGADNRLIDVNAITRLQYVLDKSYSTTTYPNALQITATLRITNSDYVSTGSGKWITVAAYILDDKYWGKTTAPTPSQVYANSHTVPHVSISASPGGNYATSTLDFPIQFTPGASPNTKLWILLLPVTITTLSSPKPTVFPGITINTFGRGISMWTNRTPGKPTITSPSSGSVFNPGDKFKLAFSPNDPDAVTPNDANRSNIDLAGVHIQVAPQATTDNPNPEWQTYAYKHFIAGSAGATSYAQLVKDQGITISVADPAARYPLTSGDWQFRIRTADFGHPYPNLVAPYGAKAGSVWTFENAPASNISPWSDPIKVSVPTQSPPPIPLSPTQNVAITEGSTVNLSWKYRNQHTDPTTHLPAPYPQVRRWVQIRKVGDPIFTTIFAGASSATSVDLPPVLDNPDPVPASEYFAHGDFEDGGVAGFTNLGSGVLANSTTRARSGTHSLVMGSAAAGYRFFPTITPGHNVFTFSCWIYPNQNPVTDTAGATWVASVIVGLNFTDAAGNGISPNPADPYTIVYTQPPNGWGGQWIQLTVSARVPPGATQVVPEVTPICNGTITNALWMDDVSLSGSSDTNTGDFTLEATNQYEWQVSTEDSSGFQSGYSQSAFFYVVDAPASGSERPVPVETIDGATLGCGTHRAFVYRRGGKTRVGEIRNISHLDWGRLRDDISTSKVVVSGWDVDCGNLLANLQTWAYELVIFRDNGYSVDRVWEGPITLLTYEADKVTIQAKDVMGYVYRRILRQKMTTEGGSVVARAAQVLQNAFAPDDPNVLGYLQIIANDSDAKIYKSTEAYSRTAFEEVDDMAANSGMDYAAVGRAILLWGTKSPIGRLPEFRDEDLGAPPIVSEYGMSFANRYVVSDGNGIWGGANRLDADGNDSTYGLVEMLSSTWASDSAEQTGTYTQDQINTVIASFEDAAEQSISDRYPPPVVVRVPDNTTLNPDAIVSIQQLVPGVVIPLRSSGTLRTVVDLQKLDSITVTEENGAETITITMSPFGGDDTLASEETA